MRENLDPLNDLRVPAGRMDTPIAFGTDGWRADEETFTIDHGRFVAQALATFAADYGLTGAPIAIGYDPRGQSRTCATAMADVLTANGIDVRRYPRDLPTPLLAWQIAQRRYAGGLMVTASDNPPLDHGVKIIMPDGAPALPSMTNAVEARLSAPKDMAVAGATDRLVDPRPGYLEHIRELVDVEGIDRLRLCYDAMHGSGRGVVDRLLEACGAAVITYRCTRDPTFGGTQPDPTPDRLGTLERAVRRADADLGIATDGDGDRIAVVTPERGVLEADVVFAAVYDHLLDHDRGPVVRTVASSHVLDRIAAAHDESTIETAIGFKWVAAAMREHDALVGGGSNGDYTIRGHVRTKDGVLMAVLVAAMTAAEPLDERIDRILAAHGSIVQDEVAIPCHDGQPAAVLEALASMQPTSIASAEVTDISTTDGLKFLLADTGWLLVRPSTTEPMLKLRAEAPTPTQVDAVLEAGRSIVEPLL